MQQFCVALALGILAAIGSSDAWAESERTPSEATIAAAPVRKPSAQAQDGGRSAINATASNNEACLTTIALRERARNYIKISLNLSPSQLLVWREVEEAAAESEREDHEACGKLATDTEDLRLSQRIDAAEEVFAQRAAQLQKIKGPLHKFIDVLSEDQRRLLDRLALLSPAPF